MLQNRRIALLLALLSTLFVQAQTVWNGPTMVFAKASGADPTKAANQDRITPTTWITRGSIQGIYNAASEAAYSSTSPQNTEWATGSLANYASLTFKSWFDWVAHNPPGTVGVQAVLHLKSENIYIGIKFLSWDNGRTEPGGEFSYERTTAGITAPVKLVSFTAAKAKNAVALTWKTATEQNTSSFSLERSADGKQFSALGSVAAAGNSNAEKQYVFEDASPLSLNFYRLRTNDKDGAFSYSNIIAFKMAAVSAMQFFPNPATTVLHLQYSATEKTRAQIIDAAGRLIKSIDLAAGENAITIDLANLKAGVYLLKAGSESKAFIKR